MPNSLKNSAFTKIFRHTSRLFKVAIKTELKNYYLWSFKPYRSMVLCNEAVLELFDFN